jgi:hypothetical protein
MNLMASYGGMRYADLLGQILDAAQARVMAQGISAAKERAV